MFGNQIHAIIQFNSMLFFSSILFFSYKKVFLVSNRDECDQLKSNTRSHAPKKRTTVNRTCRIKKCLAESKRKKLFGKIETEKTNIFFLVFFLRLFSFSSSLPLSRRFSLFSHFSNLSSSMVCPKFYKPNKRYLWQYQNGNGMVQRHYSACCQQQNSAQCRFIEVEKAKYHTYTHIRTDIQRKKNIT